VGVPGRYAGLVSMLALDQSAVVTGGVGGGGGRQTLTLLLRTAMIPINGPDATVRLLGRLQIEM
jgi:hypothetical protein